MHNFVPKAGGGGDTKKNCIPILGFIISLFFSTTDPWRSLAQNCFLSYLVGQFNLNPQGNGGFRGGGRKRGGEKGVAPGSPSYGGGLLVFIGNFSKSVRGGGVKEG
jgi:hypothetical protein